MREVLYARVTLNPLARNRWLAITDPLDTLYRKMPYETAYGYTKRGAFANLCRRLTTQANPANPKTPNVDSARSLRAEPRTLR